MRIRQSKLGLIKKYKIAGFLLLILSIFAKTAFGATAVSYEYHWLEAEYPNTINAPFRIGNDANASEGLYIYAPNGGGTGDKAENIIASVCPDTMCSGNESCRSCPQDCPCPQVTSCRQVPSTILFCEDFESGGFSSDFFKLTCCNYSTEVQKAVVRNGDYALKTTLLYQDKTGWSPQRAEIGIEDPRTGKIGDTRWYAFSVFIPENYVADDPISREIFFQLLMHPYLNQHQKSPQFDFQIQEETMQIKNRYSVNGDPTVTQLQILFECPMSELRGKWTDWIIYAKWSDGSDGRLKIWQNGNLVAYKMGVNSYAGTGNRVFECKVGIYKWSWSITGRPTLVDKRVIYHDNIRIGGPDATYYDMIMN